MYRQDLAILSLYLQGLGGKVGGGVKSSTHARLPAFPFLTFHFLFVCFLQAKKRQIQLDTTYGSSMRELELLLDNFQIEKPEAHKRQGEPSCILIQIALYE